MDLRKTQSLKHISHKRAAASSRDRRMMIDHLLHHYPSTAQAPTPAPIPSTTCAYSYEKEPPLSTPAVATAASPTSVVSTSASSSSARHLSTSTPAPEPSPARHQHQHQYRQQQGKYHQYQYQYQQRKTSSNSQRRLQKDQVRQQHHQHQQPQNQQQQEHQQYQAYQDQNQQHQQSQQQHFVRGGGGGTAHIITARRDFAAAITRPSPKRGYLECRLCNLEVWGPNGRYHIDKCTSLKQAREMAKSHGAQLTCIAGINVHSDVFKSTRKPRPKPAKVPGFVMSHSVSVKNPRQALREEDVEGGVQQRGRKGYVRCLRCNSEVFAPNARYHAIHCEQDTLY